MKKLIIETALLMLCFTTAAQEQPTERIQLANENRYNHRNEFVSYSTRELSASRDRNKERFYKPINDMVTTLRNGHKRYIGMVEMPIVWLEKDVFLHTEGSRNTHNVYVNDKFVGSASDSRTPSEFNIAPFLKDGANSIAIEVVNSGVAPEEVMPNQREEIENVFVYAQPKVRIDDVIVRAVPDSTKKNGMLYLDVVVSSSYNYNEPISIGYDIYTPENKLLYYDIKDGEVGGQSQDTLHFETYLYGAMQNLWSDKSPKLYDLTVYTRHNRIISEYIPFKIGVGETTWKENTIYRNEKPISISATKYDAASSRAQTDKDIKALKKKGINTIYVSYPQPYWFYELCDATGMYVVDRANINTAPKGGDRTTNGTAANDPKMLDDFMERVQAMYYRSRIHPCVIAWSLGGESGNGYNMYKVYQWLDAQDDLRPIVYTSEGEWNSDMELPEAK